MCRVQRRYDLDNPRPRVGSFMNEKFEYLLSELYAVGADVFRIAESIRSIEGHHALLLNELHRQAELDDAGKLFRLLWTISLSPSTIFIPALCTLLEDKKGNYYIEAVVDAMHIVADPTSVSYLRSALGRYEPWDQDFTFNRKILWALERIGTPEALEVISSTLKNEHTRIRDTAEEILERKAS